MQLKVILSDTIDYVKYNVKHLFFEELAIRVVRIERFLRFLYITENSESSRG